MSQLNIIQNQVEILRLSSQNRGDAFRKLPEGIYTQLWT